MKALRVHDMHQHHRHGQAQTQAGDGAQRGPRSPFKGHYSKNLPSRQAQVGQQAKFFTSCQHLRAKARRHAKQANANGHRLQPVSDGKTAVEDFERGGAKLPGSGKFEQLTRAFAKGVGQRAQGLLYAQGVSLVAQPER